MKYDAVLFDLDGTITFPKTGIVNSVDFAFKKCGIDEPDKDKLTRFIGPALITEFQIRYKLSPGQAEDCVSSFREYYVSKGIYECELVPGIDGLLSDIKNKGIHLHIATGKPTQLAEKVLSHFNLINYFDVIIGSNLDGTRVHKYEIIEEAMSRIDAQRPVMVGDREHDIEGAQKNSIDCIAVTYGYGERDVLESFSPAYIADSLDDIRKILL